jgi:hypothetical protein
VDVARKMFQAYEAFIFRPIEAEMLPAIKSLGDDAACVARLRRIMEDPQQLLSNCLADYIIDELRRCITVPRTFRFRALRMSNTEADQEQDRASSVLVHHRQLASPQNSALIQISMSSSR